MSGNAHKRIFDLFRPETAVKSGPESARVIVGGESEPAAPGDSFVKNIAHPEMPLPSTRWFRGFRGGTNRVLTD